MRHFKFQMVSELKYMRIMSHTKAELMIYSFGVKFGLKENIDLRKKRGIDFLENLSQPHNHVILCIGWELKRLLKGLNLLTYGNKATKRIC